MSFQITGKVLHIGDTQTFNTKRGTTFSKRELVLDCPDTGRDGTVYENTPCIEFAGDKAAKLDALAVGETVTVVFAVQGRQWVDRENRTRYITTLQGFNIARPEIQQAPPMAMPVVNAVPFTPQESPIVDAEPLPF